MKKQSTKLKALINDLDDKIGNPLTAISLIAQGIIGKQKKDNKLKAEMKIILKQVNRIENVLDEISNI